MQVLASQLRNVEIFSLQSAEILGHIDSFLLQASNLQIILVKIKTDQKDSARYLLPKDIRFASNGRLAINSVQELSLAEDLIRFKQATSNPLVLYGLKVITESGKKLGKVEDYTIDSDIFFVAKIHVQANLFTNPLQNKFIIDRTDIIDVKKDQLVIKDAYVNGKQTAPSILPIEYS